MAKSLVEQIKEQFDDLKSLLSGKAPAGAAAAAVDHTKTISDFQASLTKFETELSAKDGEITKLKADLATANTTITAKDGEITQLKAKDKTAGEKAADIVAAQGLKPEQMPAAGAPGEGGKATISLKAQYLELVKQGKSTEAGKFYAEHSAKPEFWK